MNTRPISDATYGYSAAELLVQVLQQCGDDLSRDNVMRQAANLKDVKLDLLLPGFSINTSRSDYRVVKQSRMMRASPANVGNRSGRWSRIDAAAPGTSTRPNRIGGAIDRQSC